VGLEVRNMSTRQFLSHISQAWKVQPVDVGPRADGLQMWEHISYADMIFVSSDQ
jgi:hypothetical protein